MPSSSHNETHAIKRRFAFAPGRLPKICGTLRLRVENRRAIAESLWSLAKCGILAGKSLIQSLGSNVLRVTPQDVKSIGMDVLRHRVAITYEAEAEEKTSETVIQKIFDELPVP